MFNYRKIVIAALIMLLSVTVIYGASSAQSDTVGVVNLQEVMENHPGLPEVQMQYQESAAEIQQELEQLGEEEQEAALGEYQEKLQQVEMELQQSLLNDIHAAVEVVAEDLGFTTVIDSSALLYGGNDITEYVIEELQPEEL